MCTRQFSVFFLFFLLNCKLWKITSLSDIITHSGSVLAALLLYWILHLFGISRQGLNPLSQAYLLPQFQFFFSPLAKGIGSVTWSTLLQCYWKKKSMGSTGPGAFTNALSRLPVKHWGHCLCFNCLLHYMLALIFFGQSGLIPFSPPASPL